MDIIPAIDLKGGQVVRLLQGDYEKQTSYNLDPVETALKFRDSGAHFLHVVDLDGARGGHMENLDIIREIAGISGLFVEVGGGIRDKDRILDLLDIGVNRIILGSSALDETFLRGVLEEFGTRIAVGVDINKGVVAVHGWTTLTDIDGFAFCSKMATMGVSALIVTDISKDGALSGVNARMYSVLKNTLGKGCKLIASGGVSSVDDIKKLRQSGADGAIVGKALYEGKVNLGELLRESV
jgi:phosphoribosylformimino-5-aminoimidazole carboxamide ribotide isomerase